MQYAFGITALFTWWNLIDWRCPNYFVSARNRTHSVHLSYGLYSYFSGLSIREPPKYPSSYFIKPNHVSIWNFIQKYKPRKLSSRKKRVEEEFLSLTGYCSNSLRVGMALMGGNRVCQQWNSTCKHIQGKKNVVVAKRFLSGLRVWRTFCFDWLQNMVSAGMLIPETGT